MYFLWQYSIRGCAKKTLDNILNCHSETSTVAPSSKCHELLRERPQPAEVRLSSSWYQLLGYSHGAGCSHLIKCIFCCPTATICTVPGRRRTPPLSALAKPKAKLFFLCLQAGFPCGPVATVSCCHGGFRMLGCVQACPGRLSEASEKLNPGQGWLYLPSPPVSTLLPIQFPKAFWQVSGSLFNQQAPLSDKKSHQRYSHISHIKPQETR